MKKSVYFNLQLKRAFKIYPSILVITCITIASIAIAAVALLQSQKNDGTSIAVRTGVVGDVEDSYLGIGVEAIKKMDSSRFYIDLVNMTEEEAKRALKNGEISGYVYIPENFVQDVTSGKESPLKYVSLDDPGAINKLVEQEVVTAISSIVEETQKNIYAAIDVGKAYNQKDVYKKINKLNLSYISFILNRDQIHELTIVGVKDELTYGGYYLCAIIIFFLSVWGMSCNSLISERNHELSRLISLRGIGTVWQMFVKTMSFLSVTYVTLGIFAIVFGVIAQKYNLGIPEILGADVITALIFIIKMLPAVAMFVLMHITLCELLSGVGGILTQFIIAIGLGYVSGVFYPNTFFPEAIQQLASHLPLGAAFSYTRKLISHADVAYDLKLVAAYCVLFFATSVLVRKYKITGDRLI